MARRSLKTKNYEVYLYAMTRVLGNQVIVTSIKIYRVKPECETVHFDCGNPSIERQIGCSYFASLFREGDGYEIVVDDHVVGYFMIELTVINAASLLINDQEMSSGLHQCTRYGAVKIVYLAVGKEFQKNGYGTVALGFIVASVHKLSQRLPIRYIVLDALKDKVKWYTDRGFFEVEQKNGSPDNPTTVMLMDFCDHKKLEQYIEESIG